MLKAKVNPFDHSEVIVTKNLVEVAKAELVKPKIVGGKLEGKYTLGDISCSSEDDSLRATKLLKDLESRGEIDFMVHEADRVTQKIQFIMALVDDGALFDFFVQKFLTEGKLTFSEDKDFCRVDVSINEIRIGFFNEANAEERLMFKFRFVSAYFRQLEALWLDRIMSEYKLYKSQQEKS